MRAGSLLDPTATLAEAQAIANLVKTIGSAAGLQNVCSCTLICKQNACLPRL